MKATAAPLSLALLLLAAPAARADLLQLKDGRVLDGMKLAKEKDAIAVRYANGEVRVPLELVEDWVIEGAPLPEPADAAEREKRAQGLVPWKGKWIPVAARDKALKKELDARAKAIEEYRKHREWRNRYRFKTKNFDFESTLSPSINEDYAEMLETYFAEFGKLWKTQVPKDWGRLKICFYANREEYLRTSGGPGSSLAYYRFVEPRELNFFYDRGDVPLSVRCLYHEANHYLVDLVGAGTGFQYPHWVNESMAEYYGAALWDAEKKTMALGGIQHGRLAIVRSERAAGNDYRLKRLLTDMGDDYEHYTWGWSFVHYLMETPKYRPKFLRFFWDLSHAPDVDRQAGGSGFRYVKSGEECLRVFLARMALKEKDLEALEKEWYAHIDALDATSLRGYEDAGLRAFQEGKWKFVAPRLLKEAADKGSRRARVWTVYAACLYARGDDASRAEALKAVEKACELDPLEGDVWALRGGMTWAAGNKPEGTRMVALAREMNPDDDYPTAEEWAQRGGPLGKGE